MCREVNFCLKRRYRFRDWGKQR